jgi:hypothetical protein
MLGSIYCKLPPDPICLLFCEREIHAFHEIEEDSQSDKALFLYQEIRKEIAYLHQWFLRRSLNFT